jgi:hypothetical protein
MHRNGRSALIVAWVATAVVVVPPGWLWQARLLPDAHSIMDITHAENGGGPCACRKPHPCRSGGMFVFVQDASKPITSSDPEPGYLVWVSDRGGQWVQGSGVGEALVRPVAVVEAFEFVNGYSRCRWFQTRVRSNSSWRHLRTQRSMIESMRGVWMPLSTTLIPASASTASNNAELAIPVADEVPGLGAGIFEVHDEIPRHLCHPGSGRMGGGSQDPDPAGGVLDHGKDVHPRSTHRDRFQEVTGQQGIGLRPQEVCPGAG